MLRMYDCTSSPRAQSVGLSAKKKEGNTYVVQIYKIKQNRILIGQIVALTVEKRRNQEGGLQ